MAYGETNLKQFSTSFVADNIEQVNKEFIWFLMDNRNIQVNECKYDEGTRWTVLKVIYSMEIKEENINEDCKNF